MAPLRRASRPEFRESRRKRLPCPFTRVRNCSAPAAMCSLHDAERSGGCPRIVVGMMPNADTSVRKMEAAAGWRY